MDAVNKVLENKDEIISGLEACINDVLSTKALMEELSSLELDETSDLVQLNLQNGSVNLEKHAAKFEKLKKKRREVAENIDS